MVMRFPAKKKKTLVDQKPCAIFRQQIMAFSSLCRAASGLPPPPQRLYGQVAGRAYADHIIKISRIGLPDLLTYGAPLRGLWPQRSSAKTTDQS